MKKIERVTAVGNFLAGTLAGDLSISTGGFNNKLIPAYARLIDKAKYEYNSIIERINDESKERSLSYEEIKERNQGQYWFYLSIVNHAENCINAISRAGRIITRLEFASYADFEDGEKLKNIRNTIEHIDERIVNDFEGTTSIHVEYEPTIQFSISKYKISLTELYQLIETLYDIWEYQNNP